MVLLGNLSNAAGIVWLPNKGLAHAFHSRSSARPHSDFLLVVRNAFGFVIIGAFGNCSFEFYLSGVFFFYQLLIFFFICDA